MTDTSPHPALRQERDVVPRGPVYGAAVALALLVLTGGVVTWIADRGVPVRTGLMRETTAVTIVPHEVEAIDQTLFAAHQPSRGNWADKRRELDSYHWVDRTGGVVRIPVERAMDAIVERGHVE